MKISNIRIENFRSIETSVFDLTDFNVCVGQNNCGKTNFFEAIEFFFNGTGRGGNNNDLKFKREADREILVELTFTGRYTVLPKCNTKEIEQKLRMY